MNRLRCLWIFLFFSSTVLLAQANEAGKFRLHKFEQAIGEENYTITADGGALTLKTTSSSPIAAPRFRSTATLRTSDSYVPQSFTIKGNTSRMSQHRDRRDASTATNATIQPGQGHAHGLRAANVSSPSPAMRRSRCRWR